MTIDDVFGAAYKLNDWLNFYWNFYVVFTGVVIGWVFNSKGWSTLQRVIVSIFYLGFVGVSLDALLGTYQALGAATLRLKDLVPPGDTFAITLASHLGKADRNLGIALHIAGDLLVLACIWMFTAVPLASAGAASSSSSPRS